MIDISVIVPVYNSEKTLSACVQSILMQTGVDFELILVDDGSKDGSHELCDKLATQDDRVKVIHKANGGVSSARNCGLEAARGKYIYFADSDDIVMPDALSLMYNAITAFSVDLVIANYIENNLLNGHKISVSHGLPTDRVLNADFVKDEIFHRFYVDNCVGLSNLWNKLFKKSVISENSIRFDEKRTHGEDWKFVIDYLINASRVTAIEAVVYSYNLDGSQSLLKYRKGILKSIIESYSIKSGLKENGNFRPTFQEDAIVLFMTYTSIMQILNSGFEKDDIDKIRKSNYVKDFAHKVMKFPRSRLRECSQSRRIYPVAFCLAMGWPRLASKIYRF